MEIFLSLCKCFVSLGFVLDAISAINCSKKNDVLRACYHVLWCVSALLFFILLGD